MDIKKKCASDRYILDGAAYSSVEYYKFDQEYNNVIIEPWFNCMYAWDCSAHYVGIPYSHSITI